MICGFIGLGLIGGSIAKAIKNYDSTILVTAYDPNNEMLQLAHKEGIVNKTASGIKIFRIVIFYSYALLSLPMIPTCGD